MRDCVPCRAGDFYCTVVAGCTEHHLYYAKRRVSGALHVNSCLIGVCKNRKLGHRPSVSPIECEGVFLLLRGDRKFVSKGSLQKQTNAVPMYFEKSLSSEKPSFLIHSKFPLLKRFCCPLYFYWQRSRVGQPHGLN